MESPVDIGIENHKYFTFKEAADINWTSYKEMTCQQVSPGDKEPIVMK